MANIVDILKSNRVLGYITGINAAVFFIVAACSVAAKFGEGGFSAFPLWLELSASPVECLKRPWTLLTYMFTHADFLHMLFNVLWLLWFGSILLERVDTRKLVVLYVGGGITGGLLYMAGPYISPGLYEQGSVLLGASAAVLAVMVAAAILMPNYRLHLFFIGDVPLKWLALVMIVLAFLGLGGGNAGGQVAHIGGVAFGGVVALVMRRSDNPRKRVVKEPKRRNPFEGKAMHNPVVRARMDAERLDQLLDKIHRSGFNSLTKTERVELEDLSKRVTGKPGADK